MAGEMGEKYNSLGPSRIWKSNWRDLIVSRFQNPDKPGQFSYCQYPFILSIVAKRHILTKVMVMVLGLVMDSDRNFNISYPSFPISDTFWYFQDSEQQMILTARRLHIFSNMFL